MRHLWPAVAVPAALRPLPVDQARGQEPDALVTRQAEANADRQRVTLLRPTPAVATVDNRHATMTGAQQPLEDRLVGRDGAGLTLRDAQLDERDEAPVSPHPFAICVHAEAAINLLAV